MSKRLKPWMWGSAAVLALVLFAAGCGGSAAGPIAGGEEAVAGTEAITSTAPTVEPTASTVPATAVPKPTATALPEVKPTPEATPVSERDLPLVEAEQVALEWRALVTELFADPRDMDISRMIQLEAGPDPVQPMTNWTLRAVANLNRENRFQPAEGVQWELVGSQWDPNHPGQLAWVDVCIQTGGVWFDIDTEEPVMTSHTDPFVTRHSILTDTMQIAAISEEPEGNGFTPCEFAGDQS